MTRSEQAAARRRLGIQALRLRDQGYTRAEVCERLGISLRTLELLLAAARRERAARETASKCAKTAIS